MHKAHTTHTHLGANPAATLTGMAGAPNSNTHCGAQQTGAAVPTPNTSKKLARLRTRLRNKQGFIALLFMLPSLLGIGVFFLFPFVDTVRRSFFDAMGRNFTGFSNYLSVFQNSAFRLAAGNTAKFIGICLPVLLAASLVLALLVRTVRPGGRRFKTTYLLPMAIPVASIVLLWQVLFHQNGLLNGILVSLGAKPVDFMGSNAAFWVLIFTYVWKNAGYNMVLWLAGLDGISESLYEAAKVDGAGAWQCFRYVTLPSLLPTAGMVAILSLLSSFKVFREAYLVAGPYPHDSMYLLQHLFNNWFVNMDVSRLCAAAVLLTLVLLAVILLMQKFLKDTT